MLCIALRLFHEYGTARQLQPVDNHALTLAELGDGQTETTRFRSPVRQRRARTDMGQDWIGDGIAISAQKCSILREEVARDPSADITLGAFRKHAQQRCNGGAER